MLARVGDDVAFGCENLGVPRDEIWPRVGAALDAVGLDVPLDHSTAALSGGQKQRLALAGVLAMRPGLILLDEPTANLDPDGVREVRDAVASVADETGATLVVVEHRCRSGCRSSTGSSCSAHGGRDRRRRPRRGARPGRRRRSGGVASGCPDVPWRADPATAGAASRC